MPLFVSVGETCVVGPSGREARSCIGLSVGSLRIWLLMSLRDCKRWRPADETTLGRDMYTSNRTNHHTHRGEHGTTLRDLRSLMYDTQWQCNIHDIHYSLSRSD